MGAVRSWRNYRGMTASACQAYMTKELGVGEISSIPSQGFRARRGVGKFMERGCFFGSQCIYHACWKNREAYRGYLGEADVTSLGQGHKYPLGGGLAVVCVEDAVVQGETLNRAVYDSDGNFQTVLAGDLAAVRYEGGCFKGVCKEDIASIENALKPVGRIAYGKVCLKAASTLPKWEGE